MEWLDKWLESSFRGVPEVHPDTFIGGLGLEMLTFAIALCGIVLAYTLYKKGLEHADRDPLDRKLGPRRPGPRQRLLLRRRRLEAGRWPAAARFAGWLDRVVDNKIIDGTVNGVGWLFCTLPVAWRPADAGRPGAALRARRSPSASSACSSTS